ncbi:MAG: two-component system, OmpR family, response regulator [Thermovirga sp.]|nr:two-component system, OmpR family, response regulator [Thermovirga sp.]
MGRILLVEDDVELCELLHEYLESEGLKVEWVHDGGEGLKRSFSNLYDMIILDLMLPGMDGLEVLKNLRKKSNVPVIILTAKGDDVDRIVGLELGADDYVPKPFNPRELLARIRAVLRRAKETKDHKLGSSEETISVGDLKLYPSSRTVLLNGMPVELTSTEYELLEFLVSSAGKLVSRQKLVQKVLKRSYSPFDRSVDVHISNLRKKLGPYKDGQKRIKTVRGEGYIFTLPKDSG